jgi:hypothetical protein
MRKFKKNQIFENIRSVGLDPKEFDLEDDEVEVRIKHKWSESRFVFRDDPGSYVGHSIVGDASEWTFESSSWQLMIPRIRSWLEEVKLDLETPDLWAELQREAELLGANYDDVTENTPFNPNEQKEIERRLQQLAEHVERTHSLSSAQMRVLSAKLDYLVKAAGRLGRIDWRNAFAGVILGFILSAALPPEAARDILLGLFRGIGHFIGLPELPPG